MLRNIPTMTGVSSYGTNLNKSLTSVLAPIEAPS